MQVQNQYAVSVLIPSFNPGEYFPTALESALSQLMPDDEIVIQDAMSNDGTGDLLASLRQTDARVKPVIEKDSGQSDALNRALVRATNPWVIWLNADDVLLDAALASLRKTIKEMPDLDIVVGAHQIIRADGSVVDTFAGRPLEIERMIKRGCAAFSGSILVRREFLTEVGGFDADLNTVMDLSLQLRMAKAQPRQTVISAPLGALRFHEGTKTATLWPQFVRESHSVRMHYASGSRARLRVCLTTGQHWASWPLFRVRLTPTYRAFRRRLVRVLGR